MTKRKKYSRLQKLLFTAMTLALVLGITVGISVAFVLTETDPLENTFIPAVVRVSVQQDLNRTTGKLSSVTVVNDNSNIPVYIRVAVVTNWCRPDGNICGGAHDRTELPAFALGAGWVKGDDGFYYYTTPVAVNAATANLFAGPITLLTAGDGCTAQIYVLASAIQAQGSNGTELAYQDAWAQAPALQ